jgi:cell wall-associated NlpC family hydrolase
VRLRRLFTAATVLLALSAPAALARASAPNRHAHRHKSRVAQIELAGGAMYTEAISTVGATLGTSGESGTTGTTGTTAPTGPTPLGPALTQTVPGTTATILPDGYAAAPASAPLAVQQAIWAGNQLIGLPYIYGGGHASFIAPGYDCSGTVSYALHGGGLLATTLDSTGFETWGNAGPGAWITVYTNAGHAFLEIAGIRLDTSAAGDPGGLSGPRWRPPLAVTTAFQARSPVGY